MYYLDRNTHVNSSRTATAADDRRRPPVSTLLKRIAWCLATLFVLYALLGGDVLHYITWYFSAMCIIKHIFPIRIPIPISTTPFAIPIPIPIPVTIFVTIAITIAIAISTNNSMAVLHTPDFAR